MPTKIMLIFLLQYGLIMTGVYYADLLSFHMACDADCEREENTK
jgi:hypothetical protein